MAFILHMTTDPAPWSVPVFGQNQFAEVLEEHEAGQSASELCRKHEISDATFYKWRTKFGGMEVSDARKLKGLEEENWTLKKLLAAQRRRFGYRRLHILMAREGIRLNHKRLFRLYREERLTVRRRGGRKRALGTRAPLVLPKQMNHRWSLDFVSDALLDSRRFRILAVVDDFSRESLALVSRHFAVWRTCCP